MDIPESYETYAAEFEAKLQSALADGQCHEAAKICSRVRSIYLNWIRMPGSGGDVARDLLAVIDTLANRVICEKVIRVTQVLLARCESPIERALIFSLGQTASLGQLRQAKVQWDVRRQRRFFGVHGSTPSYFRLDIAFPQVKLAIECDGHEFHKSKEHRGRDARRDRELQADGWMVLRFTGSEITASAANCARSIVDAVEFKAGLVAKDGA